MVGRKSVQTIRRGHGVAVSVGYAVFVYVSKIPLAWGQLKWVVGKGRGRKSK
jgi:hypothetical protein